MDIFNIFWLCTFVALIVSFFIGGIYVVVLHFSRLLTSHADRRAHLADAFPVFVDEGLLHVAVGGLGLIGVGTGTQLFDEHRDTVRVIGYLIAVCFFSYLLARLLASGPMFRVCTYIGLSSRLAIMGVVTSHFASPSLEPLAIPIAFIWTLFLLLSHYLGYFLQAYLGLDPDFGRNRSCPSHHEVFVKVADVGSQLSVFTLGLVGVGVWGQFVEKSHGLHELLAAYGGSSFWLFYGARMLGRGLLFEVLVFGGVTCVLAMFMTSLFFALHPFSGYMQAVFTLSVLFTLLGLEWCRIRLILEMVTRALSRLFWNLFQRLFRRLFQRLFQRRFPRFFSWLFPSDES